MEGSVGLLAEALNCPPVGGSLPFVFDPLTNFLSPGGLCAGPSSGGWVGPPKQLLSFINNANRPQSLPDPGPRPGQRRGHVYLGMSARPTPPRLPPAPLSGQRVRGQTCRGIRDPQQSVRWAPTLSPHPPATSAYCACLKVSQQE